ncbi:GIY-YIG nuclease family protein [Flavobacterium beibuense]|uniref:HNH nuclease n=1 Tax=Flavobacterium beibuense TaxID=657326 RepID=A0A444WEL3_9FLAO|nr:GIY-YIG nuclease family protein [Flavobacterium beibuense]RYJ44267.1 HNH nuclease [Flavobacterium beibuense]
MNKEHYQKKSFDLGLPSRCPLLQYCERHARTIYFFSDYSEVNYTNDYVRTLISEGVLPDDFNEKKIPVISEQPSRSKSTGYLAFSNMCPEVNLYDTDNRISIAGEKPCTDGIYDKESHTPFISLTEKHYSECLEFSNYVFENKFRSGKDQTSKTAACYVYLMQDCKNRRYKIGMSKNPDYREKTLRSEDPEITTLGSRRFMTRKLAADFEKNLHAKYLHQRVRGEWFCLGQEEVDEILSCLLNTV